MTTLELVLGDITKVRTEAIVNAANNSLLGGGGVDGAIHRAAGPALIEACRRINKQQGGCPTGQAIITTAGNLPARYVIHTVGPVWQGGHAGEEQLLLNAYQNSLLLAEKHLLKSIAFPNISTGVYHFPRRLAAQIAVDTCRSFAQRTKFLDLILFVCWEEENYELYQEQLRK